MCVCLSVWCSCTCICMHVCLYLCTTHLLLRQHKAGVLRQMANGRIERAQLPGKKVLLGLFIVVQEVLKLLVSIVCI